jgi:hypothetical protein
MAFNAAALQRAFNLSAPAARSLFRRAKRLRGEAHRTEKGWIVLEQLEKELNGFGANIISHGVEKLPTSDGSRGVYYINMGDTYDATILYDPEKRSFTRPLAGFSVGSWGDVVERQPRRFAD